MPCFNLLIRINIHFENKMPSKVEKFKMAILSTNYPKYFIEENRITYISDELKRNKEMHSSENQPILEFTDLKNGVLYVTCGNAYTRNWLIKVATTIVYPGTDLGLMQLRNIRFRAIPELLVPSVSYAKAIMCLQGRFVPKIIQNLRNSNPFIGAQSWGCLKIDLLYQEDRANVYLCMKSEDWSYIEAKNWMLEANESIVTFVPIQPDELLLT